MQLRSRRISGIIQRCIEIPGKEVFQYLDEEGIRHSVDSGTLNAYIREAGSGHFTAKDFRTWQGTLQALKALRELGCCEDQKEVKSRITAMLQTVADKLGNTTTVCRKYYVHPTLLKLYGNGKLSPYLEAEPNPVNDNSFPGC